MKDTRIRFDSAHYTLEAIKLSKKFKQIKQQLLQKYELPEDGFTHIADYEHWQDKQLKKNILATDVIKEVLDSFNLDNNDEKLQLGLRWILFFNKPSVIDSPINYLPEATYIGNVEINLSIKPWATKKDFERLELWKTIEQLRREHTKTAKTKNKKWESFERDLEVYMLYQQIGTQSNKPKTIMDLLFEDKQFQLIADKYNPGNNNAAANLADQAYKIITRCRKTFGKDFSTV
jgi:hypothetical protein